MFQSGSFPPSSTIKLHVPCDELRSLLLKRVERLKRRHVSLGQIIKATEANTSHDELRRSESFKEKVDELADLAKSIILVQFQADHLIPDKVYEMVASDIQWIAED